MAGTKRHASFDFKLLAEPFMVLFTVYFVEHKKKKKMMYKFVVIFFNKYLTRIWIIGKSQNDCTPTEFFFFDNNYLANY